MKLKSSEYQDIEVYWTEDKLRQIYMHKGSLNLVETRYKYLEEQLEDLEEELQELELERNIG